MSKKCLKRMNLRIPFLDQTNKIDIIGFWVYDEVCKWLKGSKTAFDKWVLILSANVVS